MNYALWNTWFDSICDNNTEILKAKLTQETPFLFSVIFSRQCNLSCSHCLFLDDSYEVLDKELFWNEIIKFASAIPQGWFLIHEWRILEKRHIGILVEVKKLRPDIKIWLIDNWSYVKHYDDLLHAKQQWFMFDWIDISLDGSAITHNIQRNNSKAFEAAISWIEQAQEIAKSVNILTCVTTINAHDIIHLYKYLQENTTLLSRISEWHLIDYSLTRRKWWDKLQLQSLAYKNFRNQIQEIINWDTIMQDKIKLRFYNVDNISLLLEAIGLDKCKNAIAQTKNFQHASMSFTIDDVEVYFFPQSISVGEVLVIDADLHYYLPYSIRYKSRELFDKILWDADIQNKYMVGDIKLFTLDTLYSMGAKKFIDIFFDKYFAHEYDLLKKLF